LGDIFWVSPKCYRHWKRKKAGLMRAKNSF
jgi:hypothetical protein